MTKNMRRLPGNGKKWTVDELRAGADADYVADLDKVEVRLFKENVAKVNVELGDLDPLGYRPVFLLTDEGELYSEKALGYIGPGEGRWAIRDLVLAELIGRFSNRPKCSVSNCLVPDVRTPTSAYGVMDTWNLIQHAYCTHHWQIYKLVPDYEDDLADFL